MRAAKFLLLLLLASRTSWAEEDNTTVEEGTVMNITEPCPTCDLDHYISGEKTKERWIYVDSPRCCSDCTYVLRGWKCKEKTCLLNCPWAVSSAPRAQFFFSLQAIEEIIFSIIFMDFLPEALSWR